VRTTVFAIGIILAAAVATLAQTQGPPPPPLIYAPPAASDMKSFTAADKTFSANFPGTPEVEEKMMGNGKVYSFRTYRKGSNSVIGITEFGRDVSRDPEPVFKMIRERILRKPNVNITSEKDVKLETFAGKEFVIEDGFVHRISRVYLVRERIYEIYVDATNWHILKAHNPAVVLSFEKEASRFFDSFRLAPPSQ
jgi:hypothetical protein